MAAAYVNPRRIFWDGKTIGHGGDAAATNCAKRWYGSDAADEAANTSKGDTHVGDTVDGAPSSPGVADPIQEREDKVRYATWQPEVRAVMLEIDPAKVREKFAVAEAAMAKRLRHITETTDHAERRQLEEERQALEQALQEIVAQHPELKK